MTGTMGQQNNISFNFLDQLNYEERFRDIPLFTYLTLVFVTGIFGNSVTLYIFIKSYTRSTFRLFVIYLSTVDLLSCTIGIPIEIVMLIFGFKNVNTTLCKILAFVTAWPTVASVLLLLAIAIDRYRKICKPFLWQISSKAARTIFILCASISFGSSLLRCITFGSEQTAFEQYNITISTCEVTKEMENTPLAIVSAFLFALIFLIVIVVIVALYCCIAVRIQKQINKKRRMIAKPVNKTSDQNKSDMLNKGTEEINNKISVVKIETISSSQVRRPINSTNNIDSSKQQSGNNSNNSSHSKQTNNNRSAFVMFMVTLAFFLSFAPSFPLMLIKTAIQSNLERSIYKFFIRSYLLNCVVNPLIYGLFDLQFRKLCKLLFSCKKNIN